MTGRLGVLCAGQGISQGEIAARLGKAEDAIEWFTKVCQVLGCEARDVLDDLLENRCPQEVVQPTLVALAMSQWTAVQSELPTPVIVAGYSLGEFIAATVGGAIGLDTVLALARNRGACMAAAFTEPTAMVAVRGLSTGAVEDLARGSGCYVAIINGPQEVIVAGERHRVQSFERSLGSSVHVRPLDIDVPSHTPLLEGATRQFSAQLAAANLRDLKVPLVRSRDGAVVRTKADVVDTLARNLSATIRWDVAMDVVAEMGCDVIVELGAGDALTCLWANRAPRTIVHAMDEFSTVAGAGTWFQAKLQQA